MKLMTRTVVVTVVDGGVADVDTTGNRCAGNWVTVS